MCLPTPLKKNKPDLSHIQNVFNQIKKSKKVANNYTGKHHLSGSTEEIFKSFLEKKFQLDKNFFQYTHQKEKIQV